MFFLSWQTSEPEKYQAVRIQASILSLMYQRRLPLWRYSGTPDTAAKIEQGLRAFSNDLQAHLMEGLIVLNEHSTILLRNMVCIFLAGTSKPLCYGHKFHPPCEFLNEF